MQSAGRDVNAAFHLDVLERAMDLIGQAARTPEAERTPFQSVETELALEEARAALASLRGGLVAQAGAAEPPVFALTPAEPARDASCPPTV